MCVGPEAIAALALTGVGNYIQTQQNNHNAQAQVNARNAAMMQGIQTQNKLADEGSAFVNKTAQQFEQPAQQKTLGDLVASRTGAINANAPAVPATGVDPANSISTAPKVVSDNLASKMGDAVAFAHQQGGALGRMGGVGDLLAGNEMNLNANQSNLNQVGGFARGQSGVSTAQQNSAFSNARGSPSLFGQALSTAGSVAGMDAAGGGAGFNKLGQGVEGAATAALPAGQYGPVPLALWGS